MHRQCCSSVIPGTSTRADRVATTHIRPLFNQFSTARLIEFHIPIDCNKFKLSCGTKHLYYENDDDFQQDDSSFHTVVNEGHGFTKVTSDRDAFSHSLSRSIGNRHLRIEFFFSSFSDLNFSLIGITISSFEGTIELSASIRDRIKSRPTWETFFKNGISITFWWLIHSECDRHLITW